jgi:DNA modification methylase
MVGSERIVGPRWNSFLGPMKVARHRSIGGGNVERNKLFYGDNLEVLRRHIGDESIDLAYLDPPFKTSQDDNVLHAEKDGPRSADQSRGFEHAWQWDQTAARSYEKTVEEDSSHGRIANTLRALRKFLGESDMLAQLAMMAPRLVELRRVLKPSGCIYLHCPPTAGDYFKLLMDAVFGPDNFRNEIIWREINVHNDLSRQLGPRHDTILYYAKTDAAIFEPRRRQWRSYDPTPKRHQWVMPRKLLEELLGAEREGIPQPVIDRIDSQPSRWPPRFKQYLSVCGDIIYQDIWGSQPGSAGLLFDPDEGIDHETNRLDTYQEKLGYPTQKPIDLFSRIIKSSSYEGATILDPFCGSGAAIAAAQTLGRRWIGIDITYLGITLTKHRLTDAFAAEAIYDVLGAPISGTDFLPEPEMCQFRLWALSLVGARPTDKMKVADQGIDGRLYFNDAPNCRARQIIFWIKVGSLGANHVRDLRCIVEREKAEIGVLISTNEPTAAARREAQLAGFYESPIRTRHPRLQLLTIAELLRAKRIDYPPQP